MHVYVNAWYVNVSRHFSLNICIQFIIKQYKYTLVHIIYWIEKQPV